MVDLMHCISKSKEDTRAFGALWAEKALPGDVFALNGSIGMGKTEFVRGFVSSLARNHEVRSPSFSLVNTYVTSKSVIHHFDFYRLNKASELHEIGYYEYICDAEAIVFIEWADMFPDVLPESYYQVDFSTSGEHERNIAVSVHK